MKIAQLSLACAVALCFCGCNSGSKSPSPSTTSTSGDSEATEGENTASTESTSSGGSGEDQCNVDEDCGVGEVCVDSPFEGHRVCYHKCLTCLDTQPAGVGELLLFACDEESDCCDPPDFAHGHTCDVLTGECLPDDPDVACGESAGP